MSLCLAIVQTSYADHPSESIHDTQRCAPDGIALGGYDVVSYYQDAGPQKGTMQWQSQYGDLTYVFANEANYKAFVVNPKEYLPTYMGWCSATLSMGRLACPDFANYKIENGSLLLFERIGFTNGLDMWNVDPITSRQNADTHFTRLLKQATSEQSAAPLDTPTQAHTDHSDSTN